MFVKKTNNHLFFKILWRKFRYLNKQNMAKMLVGKTEISTRGGRITKDCLICGKTFTRRVQIGRPIAKFCGHSCAGISHQEQVVRACLTCGKNLSARAADNGRKKFCSKKCAHAGKLTATSSFKTCPNCDTVFEVKSYNEFRKQVCCTMRCSFEQNSKLFVGQRVGQLILKERHFKDKISLWLCDCDCGVTRFIKSAILMKGDTVSCGCFARKGSSIRSLKNSSGSRQGRWMFSLPTGDKIKMRSGFEIIYAEHLVRSGVEFEYEAKSFMLSMGKTYTPDFYLPERDEYVEVKGYFRPESKVKVDAFIKETGLSLRLVMVDDIRKIVGGQGKFAKFYKEHPPIAA